MDCTLQINSAHCNLKKILESIPHCMHLGYHASNMLNIVMFLSSHLTQPVQLFHPLLTTIPSRHHDLGWGAQLWPVVGLLDDVSFLHYDNELFVLEMIYHLRTEFSILSQVSITLVGFYSFLSLFHLDWFQNSYLK